MLAWVLVALATAGPWISLSRGPAQPVSTQAPTGNHNSASRTMEGATSQRAAGIDWEKGSMTPPTTPQVNPGSAEKSFTYEEAYGLPPAQK